MGEDMEAINRINVVIFSKNRACQLELLLRSMKKHWVDKITPSIIFKTDNDNYSQGYQIVSDDTFGNALWVNENASRSQFKDLVVRMIDPAKLLTVFFVDDIVFKEDFTLDSDRMDFFINRNDVVCVSLRLGRNITQCYTLNIDTPLPFIDNYGMWKWKGLLGDWGYPMSVDGHIFKTSDILPKIKSIQFNGPNWLEGNLEKTPIEKTYMMTFDKSKIVNIPANRVQNNSFNRNMNIDVNWLNNVFISGKRIDLASIEELENNSVHFDFEFKFI